MDAAVVVSSEGGAEAGGACCAVDRFLRIPGCAVATLTGNHWDHGMYAARRSCPAKLTALTGIVQLMDPQKLLRPGFA